MPRTDACCVRRMNAVAHADLVAAVTNAGGIGTIGGLTLSPKALRREIAEAKEKIVNKINPKARREHTRYQLPRLCGG